MTSQDTTTTTPTQTKHAARTALHKDHAERGNGATTRKKGRLNEGKTCKGTKINPEKTAGDKKEKEKQGQGHEEKIKPR